MNRVLFDKGELGADGRIAVDGRQAAHIAGVLKPTVGALLRVGIIEGPVGSGEVLSVGDGRVELACRFEDELPPAPSVDLILAVPRPKVLRRLWAPLASLGIGQIVLTNAEKVERNYFDTHWLDEETYRPLLIEGLEQSGDTRLPQVTVCRRLKPFVEDALDTLFPDSRRLICHPRDAHPLGSIGLADAPRILLAIGPEGGWSDYEVDLFARYGFDCVSLGWRTLRSDVACIALIANVQSRMDVQGK
jgi:16S rRNA (uracil1498-N3)-methyltransferase